MVCMWRVMVVFSWLRKRLRVGDAFVGCVISCSVYTTSVLVRVLSISTVGLSHIAIAPQPKINP